MWSEGNCFIFLVICTRSLTPWTETRILMVGEMVSVFAAIVLVFGYVVAQDPDCDYTQNVAVNQVYDINNNYGAGRICRYVGVCPARYNCRVDCNLYMPYSINCSGDRLLISRSGDPLLAGAEAYCGLRALSVVSSRNMISLGLIVPYNSGGGSFRCNLTAQPAPTPPQPLCRCGEKKQTRIVGGQETRPNEYTMMAAIFEDAIDSIHCGGVIISSRHTMTAAHCLYSFRNNVSKLSVAIGEHYLSNSTPQKRYAIQQFIIHENYNPSTLDYDIALIVLQREIVFTDSVQPVCLPFKYETNNFAGQLVTLTGWGTTSFGGPTSDALRKVDVDVLAQNTCRALEGNTISDRQMCTNGTRKDACQFDSGGPVMYADPNTRLLFSVGVISRGNSCGTGHPGVNTRVTSLLRWVINNARANFCIKR